MNKIVVTGSCGFIGYNFINSLNQISEIVGIDSLNDAYDNNLKKLRLSNLNKLENFKYVQLDFSESSDFESHEYIFENCDALVHLGARAGVRQSFNDPERYLLDNTLGTTNLSLQVKKHSIPKFIIASTSSIYGDTGSKFAVENEDEQFYPLLFMLLPNHLVKSWQKIFWKKSSKYSDSKIFYCIWTFWQT